MRCILPDVKNTSKDLTFSTEQDFETMDEAKHCSALLALKHVEPLRPYEQKLPDPYRDLWLTLDNSKSTVTATIATSKKKDSKTSATTVKNKNDQKIPPPPASAASSSSTAERLDEQEDNMDLWQSTCDDDDEEEQDEKKNKFPIELTADRKFASKAEFMQAQLQRQQAKNKKRRQRENRDRANMLKQVFMSTECREKIEGILKRLSPIQAQGAIFPPIDMDSKELKEIDGHEEFYRKISEKLLSIGFLSNHAQGAIQNCQRQPNHSSEEYMTMILDWLCLHVPEEELPREFNPQGTQMDAIIHQKKSTSNHQLSISLSIGTKLIQRLMKYGYDRLDAIQVINEYFKNSQLKEDQAKLLPIEESTWKLVEILFTRLLTYHLEFDMKKIVTSSVEEKEIELLRQDEIFALEAIYMDTMQQKTLLNGDLILQVPASEHVMLEIYLPKKSKYPYELPMIAVRVAEEEDLAHPQAVLQGTREALKSCINSIGEPMIYDICVSVDNYLRQANKGRVIDKIILYPEETKISEKLVGTSSEVSSVPAPPPPPTATTKSAKIKPSNRKHGHGSSGASPAKIQALSDMLLNQHKAKLETKEYQDMQSKRNTLPAAAEKTRILQLLHNNQVLLIAGQTGCGKTTQVPQFILDEYIQKGQGGACEIICTQPRRIAAIGVATRVAEERCEQVSDVVGYQIRMEAKRSTLTRLLFCTTGVLLRRLLNDRSLQGVSSKMSEKFYSMF
jgi:ATP-dependent RNA helicase DHX57